MCTRRGDLALLVEMAIVVDAWLQAVGSPADALNRASEVKGEASDPTASDLGGQEGRGSEAASRACPRTGETPKLFLRVAPLVSHFVHIISLPLLLN